MTQQFTASQFIPLPRQEVFSFFATPRNLEAITPDWLKFRVDSESADRPGVGVEYTYRLLIRGLPFRWKSRITEWVPGERFVDVQLRGPYAQWHHTHTFEDAEGGNPGARPRLVSTAVRLFRSDSRRPSRRGRRQEDLRPPQEAHRGAAL